MYNQSITRLILDVEAFRLKKGNNIEIKNKLINSINMFTKCSMLKSIYVNEVDNYTIPDVYVLPTYNKRIGEFLVDTDTSRLYNDGPYTIEIHKRCFEKYSAEELTALLLHDILQNILSNTAKTRFLLAYTSAIDKYKDSAVMDVFESLAYSEVSYLIYMDICMRPFRLPINSESAAASDEVLKSYGIDDAYMSVIEKNKLEMFNANTDIVSEEVKQDNKTATTIIRACINGTINGYYDILKNNFPMISVNNVKSATSANIGLGFNNRGSSPTSSSINESLFKPTNETELQFQIDKIVTSMRYAENEDERAALLYKIKTLKLKLTSMKQDYNKQIAKRGVDKYLKMKIETIESYISTLENLRVEIVKMEIVPKRYGVFIQYPDGYDY